MKMNEWLGELKKFDNELNKLYEKRKKIVAQRISLHIDKMTLIEIKEAEKKFAEDKLSKFLQIESDIASMRQEIILRKVKLMKRNQDLGLNDKIIRLKMIRIELSKLMELNKSESYFETPESTLEDLNISNRIKLLENDKRALDAEIQAINWTSEI
jgi:hypothetical protein